MIDFFSHSFITDDRSGNTLVEQTGIQKQLPVFRLGMDLCSVHIHHIRQKLKGIKRNTDGKDNIRDGFRKARQRLEIIQKKYGIFKESQKSQQNNAFQDHVKLPDPGIIRFLNMYSAVPADPGFTNQENEIPDPSPRIKYQGKDKQNMIFIFRFYPNINHQLQNKKNKNKNKT